MKKIAINGLGRIGRMIVRHCIDNPPKNIEIAAINDLTPLDELAYLVRYDSVHGRASFAVEAGPGCLSVNGKNIPVYNEKDPVKLPWKDDGIEFVMECTGFFKEKKDASKHISAGASKVIVSAPSKTADLTMVMGVNEKLYDSESHEIVSNASCTTNSLAPVAKLLNDTFGIEYLMATTVHAYTGTQALVDKAARKRRRGRAAAVSLVPSSTGAAKATALVIPELKGKMDAVAVRTPVPDGAITDIVAHLGTDVTVESVNKVLLEAAKGKLKGILDYNNDEIVSADIIGNSHSGTVDAPSTRVVKKRVVKVLIWYDNEYGYARRMVDMADYMAGF